MRRRTSLITKAFLLAMTLGAWPANAAITYHFVGEFVDPEPGATQRLDFGFTVVTPKFITTISQFTPSSSSCVENLTSLTGCAIVGDIAFRPGQIFPPPLEFPTLSFNARFDFSSPFPSSFVRPFAMRFGNPPGPGPFGAGAFGTLGVYQGVPQLNLTAGTLTISGFEEPDPIPEPSTWAMLISGVAMAGAAARYRRGRRARAGQI